MCVCVICMCLCVCVCVCVCLCKQTCIFKTVMICMPIFSSLENMGEIVQIVLMFRMIECRKMNCLVVELKIKSTTREI